MLNTITNKLGWLKRAYNRNQNRKATEKARATTFANDKKLARAETRAPTITMIKMTLLMRMMSLMMKRPFQCQPKHSLQR